MVRFRSFGLTAARVAAVGFALAVLAWFVISAQRRANVDAPPAAPAPTVTLSGVDTGSITTTVDDPFADFHDVFLPTSKSAGPDVLTPILPAGSTPIAEPTETEVFLGTSKSLDLSESGVLTEIVIPPASTTTPAAGAAPAKEPIFLPSSKSRSMGDVLRPILRPADTLPEPAPVKPKP